MDCSDWLGSVRRFLLCRYPGVSVALLSVPGSFTGWNRQFGDLARALSKCNQSVRRSRERSRALLEHTTDCVAHVELKGDEVRVRNANVEFESTFGAPDGDGRSRLPPALVDTVEGSDRIHARIRRGEHVRNEYWLETTDAPRQFDFQFVPVGETAPPEGYLIYSDITPTGEHIRDHTQMERLLERAQQLANVGAWELTVRAGKPATLLWTDEVYRIHGLPVDSTVDFPSAVEFYHPDDRPRVRAAMERAIEAGVPYDLEARLVTATGNERWVRTVARPTESDGDVVAVQGMMQDITTQKRQERSLKTLHEATRGLLHAESEAVICDLVVDIADEILNGSGVGIHLLDSDRSEFTPMAVSPRFVELCGTAPSIRLGDTDSPTWHAFVTGETVVLDDVTDLQWPESDDTGDEPIHTSTRVDPSQTPPSFHDDLRSGLVVPVSDHAIVTLLTTDETVDSRTRTLVETLVSTTEAAFDRLESERSLRDSEAQLQTQNQRLNRQIHLTDIIRAVNRSLVDVDSRQEIEAAVCEGLVESDRLSFAWIGTCDDAREAVCPESWAGDGTEYLDAVSLQIGDGEPSSVTAETGAVTAVSNVVADLRSDAEPWRRPALEAGFQSVLSVPISHDDYAYGILTVYAAEPDSLGDLEASVFGELGETIGRAINAVQTRQALYSDTVTELDLQFTDATSLFATLSMEADCRVTLDGFATNSGELTQMFFSVSGAPADTITELLDRAEVVDSHRLIEATDVGGRFSATVTGGLVDSVLVPNAANPASMQAVSGVLDVTVALAPGTDVRSFVEHLQTASHDVELLARREIERSVKTRIELVDSLLDSLTDRQRETLTTAYYSGYFDWPRGSTGEEIASVLDVSQPTVNRHLRFGQLRLLEQIFERPLPGQ